MQTSVIRQWRFFQQPIELLIVFCFLLFWPDKLSPGYHLLTAIVIIGSISIHIIRAKLFAVSTFSTVLIFFNLIFVVSIFSSAIFWKSLLFCADLTLLTLYFLSLKPADSSDQQATLFGLFTLISILSGVQIIHFLSTGPSQVNILFNNPISTGILSALGAIFFFDQLLQHFNYFRLTSFVLNLLFLIFNGSKGPFLIFVLLVLLITFQKRPVLLRKVLFLLIILLLIPSPLQKSIISLNRDSSLTNHLSIWKISWQMFVDHIFTGIGADLYEHKAPAYHIANPKTLANFQNAPRSANSDYLKIVTECGVCGLFFLIILFSLLIRKKIWKLQNSSACLLLAFLIHMALFNFLFHPFFLLLFFVLLRSILTTRIEYRPLSQIARAAIIGFLLLTFLFFYLLPAISWHLLAKLPALSTSEKLKNMNLITKIDRFNHHPFLEKTKLLIEHCRTKGEIASEAWLDAKKNLEISKQLNQLNAEIYLVQAELYTLFILQKKFSTEIGEQIINSFNEAERIEPKNVFIKQQKAEKLLLLERPTQALESSLQALKLEPNFARALIFLQQNFNYFSSPEYQSRLEQIAALFNRYRPHPESYLYRLWTPFTPRER